MQAVSSAELPVDNLLQIKEVFVSGLYDPDTSNAGPAVSGLGSSGNSVIGSTVS